MRNREMYPLFTFHQQPLRLEVDPQFDILRRLDKGEAPPSLTQLFGNVKGTFPPLHSPLDYDIPVKGKRSAIKAKLKPEPPLAMLKP